MFLFPEQFVSREIAEPFRQKNNNTDQCVVSMAAW